MAKTKKPVAKAKPKAKTKKVTRKPSASKKPAASAKSRASAKSGAKKTKKAKAEPQIGAIRMLSAKPASRSAAARRPPNNPDMPLATINLINGMLTDVRGELDEYAQHLRALDRRRLNGVGIHKLGFIERAYELTLESSEFLPHYLTVERFGKDIEYFLDFRTLTDLCDQIREKLWNITIQSADIAYTDALEFYASVREAAKRRVDAAEAINNALSSFFRHHRGETEEPTQMKAKHDFNSLLHGKHDGKLVIENIKPKLTRGKRKLIDERFNDTVQFKETESADFTE